MHFRTTVYLAIENRETVEWWSTRGVRGAWDYYSLTCDMGGRLRTTGGSTKSPNSAAGLGGILFITSVTLIN